MISNERLIFENAMCKQAVAGDIISDYTINHQRFCCLTTINGNIHYIEIAFGHNYPYCVPRFSISSTDLPSPQQSVTVRDLGLYENSWAPCLSVISYVSLVKRRYTPIPNPHIEISI